MLQVSPESITISCNVACRLPFTNTCRCCVLWSDNVLAVKSTACWGPCIHYSTLWKCVELKFCQLRLPVGFCDRNGLQIVARLLACVLCELTSISCHLDWWAELCVEWERWDASDVVTVCNMKLSRTHSLPSLVCFINHQNYSHLFLSLYASIPLNMWHMAIP